MFILHACMYAVLTLNVPKSTAADAAASDSSITFRVCICNFSASFLRMSSICSEAFSEAGGFALCTVVRVYASKVYVLCYVHEVRWWHKPAHYKRITVTNAVQAHPSPCDEQKILRTYIHTRAHYH